MKKVACPPSKIESAMRNTFTGMAFQARCILCTVAHSPHQTPLTRPRISLALAQEIPPQKIRVLAPRPRLSVFSLSFEIIFFFGFARKKEAEDGADG